MIDYRRLFSTVSVVLALVVLVGVNLGLPRPAAPAKADAAWISIAIRNGKAAGPLDLIAGQDYVFQRITLAVDDRTVAESDALEWLRHQSAFSALDWDGVRDGASHWHNYRESRPDADLYSHLFTGAKWMSQDNGLELAVLDAAGKVVGQPLRLTNADFLNRQKQQDFDMIRAEYRCFCR